MPESSLDVLLRLERAWRADEPRRATGGEAALAGFHYQFVVTLRDMVRRFGDARESAAANPSILAEAVQDLAAVDERGEIVITQVKRSARRDQFVATLDNFLLIDRLSRRLEPAIAMVRFEIIVATGDIGPARAWVREWTKQNQHTRKDLAKRVRVDCRPDPRVETLALLANDLRAPDPVETFDKALATLFNAAGDHSSFVGAAQAVWSLLLEASRPRAQLDAAYIWTQADRQPQHTRRGAVLTGRQPAVADLRDGSFAPRPELADAMYRSFDRWLGEEDTAAGRLPVFFITGRSGSGKSIMLLQLMERLDREQRHPVLLASPSARNVAAVVAWSRRLAAEERCVIGLDSIGAVPEPSSWREVVGSLHGERQKGGLLPIIVTAGSQEQAQVLAEDFPDDITVRSVSMPLETAAEFEGLAHWFEQRVGHVPATDAGHGKPLVWLMFEWYMGDLREFSLRLRQRLDADDPSRGLRSVVTELLVLSQLGLAFPQTALDARLQPEEHGRLASLLRDESLAIEAVGAGDSWLTHPEIGREIYRHWYARAHRKQRTAHVHSAAGAVIEHGDAAARTHALRTLYARWRTAAIGPLLDVDWLSALASLYPLMLERERGGLPLEQLDIWITIARQRALEGPDPVTEAVQWLVPQNADKPGLAKAIEAIFEANDEPSDDQRNEIVNSVIRVLDARRELRDWPRIAYAAMRRSDAEPLRRLLAEWLAGSHFSRADGWLLGEALKRYPSEWAFREVCDRVLDQPTLPAWPLAWSGLWDIAPSETLAERGVRWMARASYADRSWGWIWTSLWNAPRTLLPTQTPVESLGHDFLKSGPPDHVAWVRLFAALWGTRRRREALLARALPWLKDARRHAHGGYPWLWELLWDDAPDRDELRRASIEWLLGNPHLPRWGKVYEKVIKDNATEEIIEIGLLWLDVAAPAHYDWGYVYPALWAVVDEARRERLYRRGRRWLFEAPDAHYGRPRVFELVWKHREDGELREETDAWLDRVLWTHFGWGLVWAELGGPRDEAARARAMRFLRDAPADHQAWARVWTMTWKTKPTHELYVLGRRWLDSVDYEDRGRSYVQREIISYWAAHDDLSTEESAQVVKQAMDWIRLLDHWGSGGHIVWEGLVFHGPPELVPELVTLGTQALARIPTGHRAWVDVWIALWSRHPTDELAAAAVEWASTAPADAANWSLMLTRALPVKQLTDEELLAVALNLLGAEAPTITQSLRVATWVAIKSAYVRSMGDDAAVREQKARVLLRAVKRLSGSQLATLIETCGTTLRTFIRSDPAAVIASFRRLPPEFPVPRALILAEVAALARSADADWSVRAALLRASSRAGIPVLDDLVEHELELQRERRELTAAGAMVAAAGRAGRLELAIEVLSWAADVVSSRSADRSLEVVVTAMPRLYRRVSVEVSRGDAHAREVIEHAREAESRWRANFPDVLVSTTESVVANEPRRTRRKRWRDVLSRWRAVLGR